MPFTTFSISSESLKFLFSGPYRLRGYYKKILAGQKRTESIIHFTSICLGLIFGLITSNTLFSNIINTIGHTFHLENLQIFLDIAFALILSIMLSSICYGISKFSVDVYNIKKYGVNNSQLAPLTKNEISLIMNNCVEELSIDENGVKQLHESICTFIKAQKNKQEKQKLKASHWLFRKGSISNACKSSALFADAVANCMIPSELSKDFIRKRTNIAYLTSHLEKGIPCESVEDHINNITERLQCIIEDMSLLRDKLSMGVHGISNYPNPMPRNNSNIQQELELVTLQNFQQTV